MTNPSGRQFELVEGDQQAVVTEVGAGLRTYTVGGREVLDGYGADEVCPSGRGQLLVPWPNRIENGSYEFGGARHQLPLNEPERGNAIHGLVRWSAWTAIEQEPGRVVLEHVLRAQPGYPFTLALSIEYALSAHGLEVRTTATNVGAEECPYGVGAHPYLTLGTVSVDVGTLHVPARAVLHSDERGLPGAAEPVDGTEYDFSQPRPIGSTKLDHTFTELVRGEGGLARVELSGSDMALTLWADESFGYLQVFTGDPLPDVARRSVAVEPMTCPANAFRTGDGLIRLQPGASSTGAWGITPT